MRRAAGTAGMCCAILLGCAGPVSAAWAHQGAIARAPAGSVLLSEVPTYARFAQAWQRAGVHAAPHVSARLVGRLQFLTPDGFAQPYQLLRSWRDPASGAEWVQLRLPGRPNGRVGWVRRNALGSFRMTRAALTIDESTLRATFSIGGHDIWSAPVGIGKPSTPTPTGQYWVTERFPVDGDPFYGVYAFATSDYSTLSEWPRGGVVGIHGTNEPQLIPGRPSHGCIRMTNADVLWLSRHLPVGAPVVVE